jgi:HEAT repeat protein
MRSAVRLLGHAATWLAISAFAVGCSTTEEQVRVQIEVLAANDIGTAQWNDAVAGLTAIGRPGARQLVALQAPANYRGVKYREFRDEVEKTRTGACTVLGRIRHKAASATTVACATVAFRPPERLAALRATGELGFVEATVTALGVQLKDVDPVVRLLAAVALVKIGEDTARDTIIQAVLHGDDELVQTAITELERANFQGVPILVELLASGVQKERLLQAMGLVRDELIGQLGDDDPQVRRSSAAALGAVGDPSAIEPLLGLLLDPSNLVRFHAASSLVRLGNERGSEFLFEALANDDPILRLNAIKSLVRVQQLAGGVEARLLRCLADDSPALRSGAAQILGQALVHSALDPLLVLTADGNAEVRWNTAIALGYLQAPKSRETLQRLVEDQDETVAYYAQWALQQLGAG